MPLLRPKEITLTDIDGNEHQYQIGKIPLLAGGREVAAQYVLPTRVEPEKYEANQKLAEIMYKHVAAVLEDGSEIILETKELVSNHIPDPVIATALEKEVYEYNTGFSVTGRVQGFQQALLELLPQLNAENIDPIAGFLIANGAANLHELRTLYSVEDSMLMHEAIMIPRINQWYQQDKERQKAGRS